MKNPLESMTNGYRNNYKWFFNGKAWAAIDIYDGLKYQLNLAYNFDMNTTKAFNPTGGETYDSDGNVIKAGSTENSLTDYWYNNATWTIENLLTYNKRFGVHEINLLAGHSAISSSTAAPLPPRPVSRPTISMNSTAAIKNLLPAAAR